MKRFLALPLCLLIFSLPELAAQCPPTGFPEPGDNCQDAPILCENLDGYCATINNNNAPSNFPGCGPPWTLNNDEWFAFYAGSTTITIQVTPLNCSSGQNMGLQGGIYGQCISQVMDVQCACTTNPFILTSNNYVIGEIYWMVLDGCAGNICDYTIDVLVGSTVGEPPEDPGPVTGNLTPCQGSTTPYSLPPVLGATTYNWSLTPSSAGAVNGSGNNISVAWGNTPGTATLCVDTENDCYANPETSCITVDIIPTPTATLSGTGVLCDGGGNDPVELTVTFTGTGPWQFGHTINGVQQAPITTSSNPYTLVITTPGTVALSQVSTVTGNCPGTVSGTVNIPLVTVNASTTTTNPGCNGGSNGAINLSVSGGNAPYLFNWSNGSSNQNQTGLQAGTYTVTVTDDNGCSQTASATLTDPPQLNASATGTNPLCNGGNTGSINLIVSGGTTPYLFNWSDGNSTQNPTGLGAGSFTGTVTDANGCEAIVNVTLTDPPQLTASATATNVLCNGANTGSISLTVGGGTTPYAFQWSNGNTSQNPTGLGAGSYTVTVTDANGCTQTASASISQPPQLTASATGTNPLCNGANTGSISLTVGGGTPGYNFLWSNGNSTQNPTGLGAGSYTVTVTDANGCTQFASVNLTNPPNIVVTPQTVNPGCTGASTGSINISVSNGTSPYLFNWSNGSSSQNQTGLGAGAYAVTVTDANGCTQFASANLVDPPQLNASASTTQQVDCNNPTGSIATSVSGGTPGYNYQWSPTGAGPNPSGLQPGSYTATVTDANGCTAIVSATVSADLTPPNAAAAANGILTCTATSISISGAGSSTGPNFTYQWTGPGIVSGGNTLNPVVNAPGSYTITVTNTANGCTETATVNVPQDITPPIATGTSPPITCNNPQVTINGAGSSSGPNFTYQWSGPGITGGGNTLTPTVNLPGSYTLVVTNTANGCTATTQVNVPNLTFPPDAVATAPPLTCTNTSITINGAGSSVGSGITYLWTTSNGNIVSGATTLTPVVNQPGTYTLTVTNANTGCVNAVSVTVDQNIAPPTVEAGPGFQLDCGNTTVQLNGAGSSSGPGFAYQWTGPGVVAGGATLTPTVNQPGTYTLTVTNTQNGCTATDQVLVTQDITPPIATVATPGLITCAVPEIQLNGTGSSTGPNFSYNWTTIGGVILGGGNTLNPTVGGGGLYTLTVTNANNQCTATFSVVVQTNLTPPIANAGPTAQLTCVVNMVQLIGAGSSAGSNFTYNWTTPNGNIVSGGNTLFPIANAPGTYTLTVTNTTNGCTASSSTMVVVDENVPIANAGPPQTLTCVVQQVVLNGAGSSTGLFSYQWTTTNGNIVSGANTLTPMVNQPGQYQLTVTSTINGCQSSSFVTVDENAVLPLAVIDPPGEVNCFTPLVTIDATGSSTQGGPYSYVWNTANGNIVGGQGTLNLLVDQGGTYILTIVNTATGCINGAGVTVAQDIDNPVLVIQAPGIVSCDDPQIALNAGGSSSGPNFIYTWTTSDGNIVSGANTATPLVSSGGTYELIILNQSNNCSTSGSVAVAENADLPTIAIDLPQELNCSVQTLALNAAIGNGVNLVFTWSTPDGSFVSGENTLQPLVDAPGVYQIDVTNTDTGCQSSDQVTVAENVDIPAADAGPGAVVTCFDPQLQLDGSASDSGPDLVYAWTTSGGNIVSGSQTTSPVVDAPGIYILTVSNTQNTCFSTDTVQVGENTTIPPAVAADPELMGCLNPVIMLDGTASASGPQIVYQWTTPDGNILSGAQSPQPEVDAPGTYTLTVSDDVNGCFSSVEIVVVQDLETPVADAGPGTELTCTLIEYTLQGTATGDPARLIYEWTTNDGNIAQGPQTLNPLVTESGIYTLTVTDTINGCFASASVEITQDENVPAASVAPSNPLNCVFFAVTLDATGSSQGPSLVYAWSTPNGNFVSGTETLTPVIDQAGAYTLTINDTINDCITSQTVQIAADTLAPPIVIANPSQLNCYNPEIQIDATAGGLSDITLNWSTSGGNITAGQNTLTPSVDQPGLYLLEATNDLNGCVSAAQVLVDSDFAEPFADAGPEAVINCADTLVALTGAGDGGGAPLSFSWSTPDGNIVSGADQPGAQVNAGGAYALLVTNLQNGCASGSQTSVTVDQEYPIADPGPQGLLNCYSPVIQLDGGGSSFGPDFSISWTTPDGNILSGENTLAPEIDQPGVYELAILNLTNHCLSAGSVAVLEDFAPPQADAGPSSELTCSLTQIALSGSGSAGPIFTYAWTTNDGNILSGASTLSPLIDSAGEYELTVLNEENGCSASASVSITSGVGFPDAEAASAPPLTCAITEIQLDGGGSATGANIGYQWTTAGGNIVSGANTLTPLVDAPGDYNLIVTNLDNDCFSTVVVSVPIDTLPPQAVAAANGILTCSVTTLLLDGSGSSTGAQFVYQWSTTNGDILSGPTTLSPEVGAPGIYNLQVSDLNNGCATAIQVVVEQDIEAPLAAAAAPGELTCAITTLNLSGAGSSEGLPFVYAWTTPDGNIVSGANSLMPIVDEPGMYNLLVSNLLNGCVSSASITLSQNIEAPVVDAGVSGTLTCATTSLSLNGSASGFSADLLLSWSTVNGNIVSGAGTLSPVIDQAGTYLLTVLDQANGCASSAQTVVGQNTTPPVLVIAPPGVLNCLQSELSLSAAGSDAGPGFSLLWTTQNGAILSGEQGASPLIGAPGAYTLTITNLVNGCVSAAQTQVVQDIAPPVVDAGGDFTLPCFEDLGYLAGAVAAPTGNIALQWTTSGGQIVSGANTLTPAIGSGGEYLLTATNLDNGCSAADLVLVLENFPANPEFTLEQPPCADDRGQIEILGVTGGTPPYLYSVNGGFSFQQSPLFVNLPSDLFTIVVQDALGCQTDPADALIVAPEPVVVDAGIDVELLQGDSWQIQTEVNLSMSEIALISWTPAMGLSCTDCLDPVAAPQETTLYRVEIVDENGCKGAASVQFFVDKRPLIYVPNVFSPNGDGQNDRFFIFARDENISNIKSFLIFSRWGELVSEHYDFMPNDPAFGWDGNFRGRSLDPAVFVWFIEVEFIDGRVEIFKGDVALVR